MWRSARRQNGAWRWTLSCPRAMTTTSWAPPSESLVPELLDAGVRVHLFQPGLIHSKIVTVDGQFAMLGTAKPGPSQFRPELRKIRCCWPALISTAKLEVRVSKAILTAPCHWIVPRSRHGRSWRRLAQQHHRTGRPVAIKKAAPAWEDARGGDRCWETLARRIWAARSFSSGALWQRRNFDCGHFTRQRIQEGNDCIVFHPR